jgi:hypothetical protein
MTDVARCYRALEESGWEPDRPTVVRLAMESDSWAAAYMVVGWFNLTQGRVHRARACLAKAEASCETGEELSYVLHAGSVAALRMGDVALALEKERACLAVCRKTRDLALVAKVLFHLGEISCALNGPSRDDQSRDSKNRTGRTNG